MVAAGYATVTTFVTPPGASYIRFQTFASDAGAAAHDLDMFAYRATPAAGAPFVLAATSGGPDQNEVVNSTSARRSDCRREVEGVRPRLLGRRRRRRRHALRVGVSPRPASNPFSAVPAAQAVTIGQVVPGTLSWAGLPAGNRYLGRVIYVDPGPPATGMAATTVAVSTR